MWKGLASRKHAKGLKISERADQQTSQLFQC